MMVGGLRSASGIPFGVMTAIFSLSGLVKQVRSQVFSLVTILTGVPSIIAGVFAYGVIVLTTKEFQQ